MFAHLQVATKYVIWKAFSKNSPQLSLHFRTPAASITSHCSTASSQASMSLPVILFDITNNCYVQQIVLEEAQSYRRVITGYSYTTDPRTGSYYTLFSHIILFTFSPTSAYLHFACYWLNFNCFYNFHKSGAVSAKMYITETMAVHYVSRQVRYQPLSWEYAAQLGLPLPLHIAALQGTAVPGPPPHNTVPATISHRRPETDPE